MIDSVRGYRHHSHINTNDTPRSCHYACYQIHNCDEDMEETIYGWRGERCVKGKGQLNCPCNERKANNKI